METELILKSDVLDILFENRNKAYGAYYLRKFYKSRLLKSISATLIIAMGLSAFSLLPEKNRKTDEPEISTTTIFTELDKKKDEVKKKKETVKTQQAQANTKKMIPNFKIVKDDVPTDTLQQIDDGDILTAQNNIVPGGDGPQIVQPADVNPGDGNGTGRDIEKPLDIVSPMDNPDIMPTYPGGTNALRKFLERNLNNPKDLQEDETVSVKMKFVVGYDGKLKSFETVQDGGEEFNKEVMRVLKKMPAWIPGKTNGQNVSVYFTIPVKFIAAER
jgi:protein TonB